MNLSGKDRLRILQNAIARAGGIDKVDLASELSKSVAMLNGISAQDTLNQYQSNMAMGSPQGTGGVIPPETTQSMPEDQSGSNGVNLP